MSVRFCFGLYPFNFYLAFEWTVLHDLVEAWWAVHIAVFQVSETKVYFINWKWNQRHHVLNKKNKKQTLSCHWWTPFISYFYPGHKKVGLLPEFPCLFPFCFNWAESCHGGVCNSRSVSRGSGSLCFCKSGLSHKLVLSNLRKGWVCFWSSLNDLPNLEFWIRI
jgi:hypothetical protein